MKQALTNQPSGIRYYKDGKCIELTGDVFPIWTTMVRQAVERTARQRREEKMRRLKEKRKEEICVTKEKRLVRN